MFFLFSIFSASDMYTNTRTHTRKFEFLQTRFQTRKKRKPPFFRTQPDSGFGFSVTHTLTHTHSHCVCVGSGLFFFIFPDQMYHTHVHVCTYMYMLTHTYTRIHTRTRKFDFLQTRLMYSIKQKSPFFFRAQPD